MVNEEDDDDDDDDDDDENNNYWPQSQWILYLGGEYSPDIQFTFEQQIIVKFNHFKKPWLKLFSAIDKKCQTESPEFDAWTL